jgi:hypothetical protein
MRPISRRQKLLGTALGVVATGWLADFLAGGGEPAAVHAAVPLESTPTADATVPAANVPDLDEFLGALEGAPTALPDLELDKLTRDPFVPTTVLRAACRVTESERVEEAEAEAQPSATVPFEQRHQLQGVLTGHRPLALIDGKLFAVGVRLEGYTLIRIERDQVVCQRGEQQVVLTLSERGE